MSKRGNLFERGNAARDETLSNTARIPQQQQSRTGEGVIQRGNEARQKVGIDSREHESEVFPKKG